MIMTNFITKFFGFTFTINHNYIIIIIIIVLTVCPLLFSKAIIIMEKIIMSVQIPRTSIRSACM